jgi:hypothetical protein
MKTKQEFLFKKKNEEKEYEEGNVATFSCCKEKPTSGASYAPSPIANKNMTKAITPHLFCK